MTWSGGLFAPTEKRGLQSTGSFSSFALNVLFNCEIIPDRKDEVEYSSSTVKFALRLDLRQQNGLTFEMRQGVTLSLTLLSSIDRAVYTTAAISINNWRGCEICPREKAQGTKNDKFGPCRINLSPCVSITTG